MAKSLMEYSLKLINNMTNKIPYTCNQEELEVGDWEKEFDTFFPLDSFDFSEDVEAIKTFIRDLLSRREEKARQDERKRIADWATKYMEQTTMHYGTDKHGIAIEDLLEELK